jgi:hypothetical protein
MNFLAIWNWLRGSFNKPQHPSSQWLKCEILAKLISGSLCFCCCPLCRRENYRCGGIASFRRQLCSAVKPSSFTLLSPHICFELFLFLQYSWNLRDKAAWFYSNNGLDEIMDVITTIIPCKLYPSAQSSKEMLPLCSIPRSISEMMFSNAVL